MRNATTAARWKGDEDLDLAVRWLSACLPENGTFNAYMERASHALSAYGVPGYPRPHMPETILWANAHSEYPGAVTMLRDEPREAGPRPPLAQYAPLADADVLARLDDAVLMAHSGRPPSRGIGHASLSGQRPKIALSLSPGGDWCMAPEGHLNTWIVKVEDSAGNPGEAGIESICQATCALVGVRAAGTTTRVLGGMQCVLSERADRRIDADGGVQPVHQEDFRQASGGSKFPTGAPGDPALGTAYSILREHAPDPDVACDELTRLLACGWLIGHADMHGGNFGFLHTPIEQAKAIAMAPAYDVSSSLGTRYRSDLIFDIGGARQPQLIGALEWRAHAVACRLDVDRTLDTVADAARTLPDAFASAQHQADDADENRLQVDVDVRCERIVEHISACAAHFGRTLSGLRHGSDSRLG